MNEVPKTVLEWNYQPKGFFETPCELVISDGNISIGDGVARGEFDAKYYDLGVDFRNDVHERLVLAFQAQQVQVHRDM